MKPSVEETVVKSEEQDLLDAVMASENVYSKEGSKDTEAANNGTDGKKIKTEVKSLYLLQRVCATSESIGIFLC